MLSVIDKANLTFNSNNLNKKQNEKTSNFITRNWLSSNLQ